MLRWLRRRLRGERRWIGDGDERDAHQRVIEERLPPRPAPAENAAQPDERQPPRNGT